MREPWQSLLSETVDRMTEPRPSIAELESSLQDGGVICPLPSLGVLHVAGVDAADFLHNQLTQAVKDLDESTTRLAAWCNGKGRTRALFRIARSDTGYLLISDADVLAAIRPKLQMFILRAQVALTDLTPSEGLMGLAGPAAETLLAETAGSVAHEPGAMTRAGDLHIIALPSDAAAQRFLMLAPSPQLADLWKRFQGALSIGDEAFWTLLDIRAGLPAITPATQESIIPTMLNLEPLGGVSYTKGCYPGQEVVARMHYLGSLKRRLYRAQLAGDPPEAGASVTGQNGANVGTVINAASTAEAQSELLAVLRIDAAEQGGLMIDEQALELLDLPYAPPA